MTIEFNCQACGKLLRVPDGSENKQAKCPHCASLMTVPDGGAAPASEPAASSSPWKEPEESQPQDQGGGDIGLNPSDDPLGIGNASNYNPAPAQQPGQAPMGNPYQQQMPAPNPYAGPSAAPQPKMGMGAPGTPFVPFNGQPHRGGLVLTFGIISTVMSAISVLMCCCCYGMPFNLVGVGLGIPAWLMGAADIKKINRGVMDPSGLGSTKGGLICGIIGTVIGAAMLVLFFVMLIISLVSETTSTQFQPMGGGEFGDF